jgi:hypothetical protein
VIDHHITSQKHVGLSGLSGLIRRINANQSIHEIQKSSLPMQQPSPGSQTESARLIEDLISQTRELFESNWIEPGSAADDFFNSGSF